MRIDAHQHFWIYNPIRDSWIDENMKVLRRNFLPEDLYPLIYKEGVDGTIAVQADQSEKETNFLLELAERNPWIVGVVGWIDLKNKKVEKRIEYFSHFPKLKGFRHIIQAEPNGNFMLGEEFQRGISFLKHFKLTYDFLIYSNQIPAAVKLSEKYPEQKFILDHIAKPKIKNKIIEPWASGIKELAANNNVFCKISGLITEADQKNWKPDDIYPFLDVVFESFGYDRLLFGSDWPVCLLAGSYKRVKNLIENYLRGSSLEIKEKIFGKNANNFYNIN